MTKQHMPQRFNKLDGRVLVDAARFAHYASDEAG
jgi:hypothetical protein